MSRLANRIARWLTALSEPQFTALIFLIFNVLITFPVSKFTRTVDGDFADFIYFLSYRVEFMKRALLGTLLDEFGIPVSILPLGILFVAACNAWCALAVTFFRQCLLGVSVTAYRLVAFFFVIAPFSAFNLGFDFLRTDVFLLAAAFAILCVLMTGKSRACWLIPPLIVAALLIHEAFLFLQLPVVAAILLDRHRLKLVPRPIVGLAALAVVITMGCLFVYGTVSPQHVREIYYSVYHRPLPADYLHDFAPIWVISSSLDLNVRSSVRLYATPAFWTGFPLVAPYLLACLWTYFAAVRFAKPGLIYRLVALSPFLALPIFFIGVDVYRWTNMMFISMTISVCYLLHMRAIVVPSFKGLAKIAIVISLAYSLLGPVGGQGGLLPYPRALWHKLSAAVIR